MTFASRLNRTRVFEALQQRARQFRSREDLLPLRVPREPIVLEEVLERSLPDDYRTFDMQSLRARTLLHLEWDGGSTWEAWVIVLPSGLKLYCDSEPGETRILASGGPNQGSESDRAFLQLLAESGGQHFGIEMTGGPPSRVRTSITDRAFVVELFLNLFEVTSAEESVREALAEGQLTVPPDERVLGVDFRSDVERWVDHVLAHAPGAGPGPEVRRKPGVLG
ncbi:MAG: hypothetical protein ABI818_12520 [Acidobacteriota bacterium]